MADEPTPAAAPDTAPQDPYKPGDIVEYSFDHYGRERTGVAVVVGTLVTDGQQRIRFVQIGTLPQVAELPATDVTRAV